MAKDQAQKDVQAFVKGQLEEAHKRWQELEGGAQKVVQTLVTRGKESSKELSKKAVDARTELKKRLDAVQNRVVEAAGVASQNQVKAIGRELNKLSRKLDGLVGKKDKPDVRA